VSAPLPTAGDVRGFLGAIRPGHDDDATAVEAWARVAWNILTEPGDGVAGRLIDAYGVAPALALALGADVPAPGIAADVVRGRERWLPRWKPEAVEDACRAAARAGIDLLLPGDEDWPTGLDDLGPHAPICLWVRGDRGRLAHPSGSVALVGARASTSYGEHVAGEISAELAGDGIAVISGAAYGIDGSAHRAALSAGGTTLAFLAGGADRAYPSGHTRLIDRIADAGAVISEVAPGSAPTKWRFLHKNRRHAGLAGRSTHSEPLQAGKACRG
jgi:DNA processing protein